MTTVSGWDIRIDTVIRQVLRDVKRDKTLLKGSMFTVSTSLSSESEDPVIVSTRPDSDQKRQTFLSLLKTALVRSFPSANIVIVRHGQIHQCRADHVMRRVEGPIPVLSDFFGFGSYE